MSVNYLSVELVVVPPQNRAANPVTPATTPNVAPLGRKQETLLAELRADLELLGYTFPAAGENNANGISRLVGDHQ